MNTTLIPPLRWLLTAASILASSCTGGGSLVRLRVIESDPLVVSYRDGDAGWRTPRHTVGDEWQLDVADDFVAVVVCLNDDGSFDAKEVAATAGEADVWVVGPSIPPTPGGCFGTLNDPAPHVTVSGRMYQPGEVMLGAGASSSQSNWNFQLDVTPAVYDLVAKTEPPNERVLVRHDVSALSDVTEPDIDMTTEGVAMIAVPLAISGAAGQTQTLTSLNTRNGTALVSITNSMTAMVVPPAILQSQDHESVGVFSVSQPMPADGGTRTIVQQTQSDYPLTDTAIMLRPPADVSYEYTATGLLVRANVDSALAHSQWGLGSETGCPPPSCASTQVFSAQSVIATAGWRQQNGSTSLAFDTSAPGYQGSWSIDFSKSYVRWFAASDESNGTTYSTESVDAINGAMLTTRNAPHRSSSRTPAALLSTR